MSTSMSFENIEKLVSDALELITVTNAGLAESKERAGRFLVVQAVLINFLKEVDDDLAKFTTLRDVTYAKAMSKAEGKITEKKNNADADPEYSGVRENYEEIQSLREWVKAHVKLFNDAHILYRGMDRGSY